MLHDIFSLQNDDSSPLYRAARNGHVAVADVLLDKEADINQIKNDGE